MSLVDPTNIDATKSFIKGVIPYQGEGITITSLNATSMTIGRGSFKRGGGS